MVSVFWSMAVTKLRFSKGFSVAACALALIHAAKEGSVNERVSPTWIARRSSLVTFSDFMFILFDCFFYLSGLETHDVLIFANRCFLTRMYFTFGLYILATAAIWASLSSGQSISM